MRFLFASLLALLFSLPMMGQMTYSYSGYSTTSSDGTYAYVTGVVDGSATCNNVHMQNLNCAAVTHQGRCYVDFGSNGQWTYGPRVNPNSYIGVTCTGSLRIPTNNSSFTATVHEESNVDCSAAGLVALFATTGLLSLSDGTLLLKNLSGADGVPGSCISKGGVIQVCEYEVVANCTNHPLWTTNAVDDAPPGLAGWWTDYWCLFFAGNVLVCRPIPGTATKTTNPGPSYCSNPVP